MDSMENANNSFFHYYSLVEVDIKYYALRTEGNLSNPLYGLNKLIVNGFEDPQKYKEKLLKLKGQILESFESWQNGRSDYNIQLKLESFKNEILDLKDYFEIRSFFELYGSKEMVINTSLILPKYYLHKNTKIEIPKIIIDDINYQNIKDAIQYELSLFLEKQYEILESLEDYFNKISELHTNYTSHLSRDNQTLIPTFPFNDSNAADLRSSLIYNGLIESADLIDLKSLFGSGRQKKQIVWTSKESLLYYFIKELIDRGLIGDHNNHWKVVSRYFVILEEGFIRKVDHKTIARLKKPRKDDDIRKLDKLFDCFQTTI